jgi:iron complex transport system permease protein
MKNSLIIISIIVIGLSLCILSIQSGSLNIELSEIIDAIFGYDPSNTEHYVLMNLRFPRLLVALLSGASLAISGYLFQSLLNNPLADPYILGTAGGASLGANFAFMGFIPAFLSGFLIPSISAFVFAFIVTLIAVVFAYRGGKIISSNLLLAGVALSSMTTAFISLMSFMAKDGTELRTIVFWIMGSFERSAWNQVPILLVIVLPMAIYFSLYNKSIALLVMGEDKAEAIGLDIKKMRWLVLISATLLTSITVSFCGAIGFVGFLIPHFIRGAFGFNFKWNIPLTMITGAFFMVFCDLISRTIYPPAGVPIGILTSFLGIPFFLYLLFKKSYRFQ